MKANEHGGHTKMTLREKQKQQAAKCLATLESNLGLSPAILAGYQKGLLTCSMYYLEKRRVALIDVQKDAAILEVVRNFESKFGAMVYHCLWGWGGLTMLYVGANEEEWTTLCAQKGDTEVWAAVPTPYRGLIDFGFVRLSSAKSQAYIGNLPIRVG